MCIVPSGALTVSNGGLCSPPAVSWDDESQHRDDVRLGGRTRRVAALRRHSLQPATPQRCMLQNIMIHHFNHPRTNDLHPDLPISRDQVAIIARTIIASLRTHQFVRRCAPFRRCYRTLLDISRNERYQYLLLLVPRVQAAQRYQA